MMNSYIKNLILVTSFILFFSFIFPSSLTNASTTPDSVELEESKTNVDEVQQLSGNFCENDQLFYGREGQTTAVIQVSRTFNSLERTLAWGLKIDPASRYKYGSEVEVSLKSATVNGQSINPPYAPHIDTPDYTFHGSLKKYQWKGKSGGGTLRYGDSVRLQFIINSLDPQVDEVYVDDTLDIVCTLD